MTTDTTTDTNDARAKWLDKIGKLLAKAEGAATQEEADAFFAKAQELMAKWEIEDAELRPAGSAADATWTIVSREYVLSTFSPKQDASAMHHVSKAMGLRGYYVGYVRGERKPYFKLFGTAEDLDRFEMMWASLHLQLVAAMRAAEPADLDRNGSRAFRLGFKVGYGHRLGERLREARDKVVAATTKGTALVLAGKDEAIAAAVGPTVKTKTSAGDAVGRAKGRAAADKADLGGQSAVKGSTRKAVTK